jgi:hypothetical protein
MVSYCDIDACACTGQVHPTKSISQPGYGGFCNSWDGGASFCYVSSACSGATQDPETLWFVKECTCEDMSAGGATCSGPASGIAFDMFVQGDSGAVTSNQWFEFSTARDPAYILGYFEGDVEACSFACNSESACVGFQVEDLQNSTIICTLLSNVGRRVRTTASTKSFGRVVR